MAWKDWNRYLHRQEEQIRRIDKSAEVVFDILDKDNGKGITSHGYEVNINECTCPDFATRELPCKHIYALAKALGKLVIESPIRTERSKVLIVQLDDNGFSKDWIFVVRECNFPSLDIRWDDANKCYTQGSNYQFTKGSVFYDAAVAYDNKPWKEVVTKIEFSLQVNSSSSNFQQYDIERKEDVLYLKQVSEYGITNFSVYRVNHNTNREEYYTELNCANNEFVSLLQKGCCKSTSGKEINIKDWYLDRNTL